jgi:type IV secretion system protein VirD4
MLGKETIIVESGGESQGRSNQSSGPGPGNSSHSSNQSSNWQQISRELLRPEEVAMLPARTAITFTPGVPPICSTLVPFFEPVPKTDHSTWWVFVQAVIWLFSVGGFSLVLAIAIVDMAQKPPYRLTQHQRRSMQRPAQRTKLAPHKGGS